MIYRWLLSYTGKPGAFRAIKGFLFLIRNGTSIYADPNHPVSRSMCYVDQMRKGPRKYQRTKIRGAIFLVNKTFREEALSVFCEINEFSIVIPQKPVKSATDVIKANFPHAFRFGLIKRLTIILDLTTIHYDTGRNIEVNDWMPCVHVDTLKAVSSVRDVGLVVINSWQDNITPNKPSLWQWKHGATLTGALAKILMNLRVEAEITCIDDVVFEKWGGRYPAIDAEILQKAFDELQSLPRAHRVRKT